MNEREKRFCEYYVGECNGNVTQAGLKAGYSLTYSRHRLYKKLENVDIKEYINKLTAADEDKRISDGDDIRRFWSEIMNNDGIVVKDRIKASELLAKSKGMFRDEW